VQGGGEVISLNNTSGWDQLRGSGAVQGGGYPGLCARFQNKNLVVLVTGKVMRVPMCDVAVAGKTSEAPQGNKKDGQ